MSINIKSVLTSGLVSELIIIISALTMIPVVGNEMDTVLANRGLPPLSNLAMVYFCFLSLTFGVILTWLYSFAKTQLGGSMKAAIIVALMFWFLAYFIGNVSMVVYGFMPVQLTMIGTIWGLGELLSASIVGSKLYKEAKSKATNR
ncbi:MAG: hypothetical protein H7Z72_02295 [Bacteroidetes bacterium]|nr:hypothetical protein [Fibrella sp.]